MMLAVALNQRQSIPATHHFFNWHSEQPLAQVRPAQVGFLLISVESQRLCGVPAASNIICGSPTSARFGRGRQIEFRGFEPIKRYGIR